MLSVRNAIVMAGAVACAAGAATAQEDASWWARGPWAPEKPEGALRVATFNIWDYQASRPMAGREERLASVVRGLNPDILLLNEIDNEPGAAALQAEWLATQFERVFTGRPLFAVFAAPVNTGVPSGFDLNNDGKVVTEPGTRGYGEDCFGFGEYPGQYGMALLVRPDVGTIDRERVRTFQRFLWKDMPGAMLPEGWYSDEELAAFRLSSKTHMDVPVVLKDGTVVHILASHPTPPALDGPEDRNGKRNHDEIRFWADYIAGGERASFIVDDDGVRGGLAPDALFVIVGDLNADPDEGDGVEGAIAQLLDHPRVQKVEPVATGERAKVTSRPDGSALRTPVEPTDTALFGLRADYALPSVGLEVVGAGTVREESPAMRDLGARFPSEPWWIRMFPSDHFPVYVDVRPPSAGEPSKKD